jgi:S-adenosylmethionine:tRNA ribosyltransferase-isomerase
MIPATAPRAQREKVKLLFIENQARRFTDRSFEDLPDLLQPGDQLIVNDAATLPASLPARGPAGEALEIRLVQYLGGSDWKVVLLGEGDWRIPTELRDLPNRVPPGTVLEIGDRVALEVTEVTPEADRLVVLRFPCDAQGMWSSIYAYGKPIQYSYIERPLDLWSVQTVYGSRPWAAEAPSAGLPLTWKTLLELMRRGIGIARVTHAAGLSAIGDEVLDKQLPFAERFDIPQSTVDAIAETHRQGGRVIAAGTTVVRALEGCARLHNGSVEAGQNATDLIIDRTFQRSVVNGILTGVHDPGQSHFRLIRAFADERLLRRAWRHASESGYRCHEFGDVCLILSDR